MTGHSFVIIYFLVTNNAPYVCLSRSPSEWALESAIRNYEEKYIFVGILEEFENSLAVLEKLLPTMFRKAVHLYQHPEEGKKIVYLYLSVFLMNRPCYFQISVPYVV